MECKAWAKINPMDSLKKQTLPFFLSGKAAGFCVIGNGVYFIRVTLPFSINILPDVNLPSTQ